MPRINPSKKEDVQDVPLDSIVGELNTKLSAHRNYQGQIAEKRQEMDAIKKNAEADIQPTLRALVLKIGLFESLPEDAEIKISYTVPSDEDPE